MNGLIRLRKPVLDNLSGLVTFYLIGCAFRGGCTSLRKVSSELERRDIDGLLPEGVGASSANLSDVVRVLETAVFAPYYGNQHLRLLTRPQGEGRGAVLGGDGWLAWEETRLFLSDYHELPLW